VPKESASQAVARAMRDIKKSPVHYDNMMNDKFSEIGIGLARGKNGKWYMGQVFGSPAK
jgi:uncharacterized protein YkwD